MSADLGVLEDALFVAMTQNRALRFEAALRAIAEFCPHGDITTDRWEYRGVTFEEEGHCAPCIATQALRRSGLEVP